MKQFSVRISVLLEPVGTPDVVVTCGPECKELIITQPTWLQFDYTAPAGPDKLTVEHRNRKSNDGVTSVIVSKVKFNFVNCDKATYHGMYYPNGKESRRTTYVNWNGVWVLDFTVPVYTWVHQIQGLGWIYD